MKKLLAADLSRLLKLRSFRIFLLLTIVVDIAACFLYIANDTSFNIFRLQGILSCGIVIEGAVILGELIGAEFTGGTVRNKIVARFSRKQIYLSYYITSFICFLILTIESYAVTAVCGYASQGFYNPPEGWSTAVSVLLILLFWLVCSSFFTGVYVNLLQLRAQKNGRPLLRMLIAVEGGLIAVVLISSFVTTGNILMPEYYDETDASNLAKIGFAIEQDPDDPSRYINPAYKGFGGTDSVTDVLSPLSHIIWAHNERLAENIIAVLSEMVVLTATGYLSFRKRDIR